VLRTSRELRRDVFWLIVVGLSTSAFLDALDFKPSQSLTRYSRALWTQKDGLPQDTVKKIVQTADGYLWVGTEEGLARFDGYDFTVFTRDRGDLPSNSVTALAAANDGSLWIGTASGLVHYSNKKFYAYSTRDGLSVNLISDLYIDHAGLLWIVSDGALWAGTYGKGLWQLRGNDRHLYTTEGLLWIAMFGAV
jgi:ligand-binding sensor domain-containing protein